MVSVVVIFMSLLINRMSAFNKSSKLPVYFVSHGGPTFMYENDPYGDKGAFNTLKKLGSEIVNKIKPDYIIVVSAHWQSAGPNLIEIDYPSPKLDSKLKLLSDEENELIYDFYGFPSHMYKEQFHSRGSKTIALDIAEKLKESGFNTKLTLRGIDHGVWVPFKVLFTDSSKVDSHDWDLPVPVIQVSLTSSFEHDIHHKLGQALAPYRYQNGLIICSGMSVHNLRDLHPSLANGYKALSYGEPFNTLLTNEIMSQVGSKRLDKFNELFTTHRALYQKAHPTNEHFLPVVVASGAADAEVGKELYNSANLSLGWGVYEFNN